MIRFASKAYLEHLRDSTERMFDYRRQEAFGGREAWQELFRAKLRELTGLSRIEAMAQGLPLSPRRLESADCGDHVREKWLVATEPGIDIPLYLLWPKGGRQGPIPLIITPHGHGKRGKEVYAGLYESEEEAAAALEGDRDIALQAVRQGYAVIAPDVRGFHEMAREEDMDSFAGNSCRELQRQAMLYGRTLIGERIHDLQRLIDFALCFSEIDGSRIIVTGNSGGGTVALFGAALDERVGICIPGSYFCTFEASIVPITHCPCNIVPGILQAGEMYDIAALIAPRPILIVHGAEDPIYPIEGTRQAFAELKRIYTEQQAEENCELYVGEGGHRFYKERVWSFAAKHLNIR